jgi:DNA-directed RNA polymerase subunit beta'
MRTFHIGGAAQGGGEQSSVEASVEGVLQIRNKNVVENSEGQLVVMGRNCELVVSDKDGRERASYKVPYGAKVLVQEGAEVEKGTRLAEWDPYTQPIITEREGTAHYEDLVEGTSMREVTDETTGITNRVVVDWKQQPKGSELRPRIVLRDENGEVVQLANGAEARYYLSVDAILSVENADQVKAGDVLARIPRESSKTRDITGGLPRVAELFEARKPKDYAILSEIPGRVEFGKDYKTKRRVIVVPDDESQTSREYMVPKNKQITVREGDWVDTGDMIVDGNPVPHDILDILGVEALAEYLVEEIQSVYRLQGVKINDKHIEVVIRQMLQKVEISAPGDTTYLVGEHVDRLEYEEVNRKMAEQSMAPAHAKPVLQGITKASLQTRSFISAASFQETTRVLTEAAVYGKSDYLEGLKENVIVGRLIPAGTGATMNEYRKLASQRDRKLLQEREQREELAGGGDAEQSAAQ